MSIGPAGAGERLFLDVAQSVSGKAWVERGGDARTALAIAQRHDLPEILGRVLAARGVGIDEAAEYLNPTLRALMPPPETLRDMESGARRIARAVMEGEPVGVIGDYDVDGTCSTAMMTQFLRACGLDPKVHIPHRVEEGYGPSIGAVDAFAEAGVRLAVTLDCGAMAHEVLAHAAARGLDTVVVDHHQMGEALPRAHAVINPNRPDDESGLGHLCAAGVAFMLIAAVARELGVAGFWETREKPDLLQWLDLVALATVCDVVPLRGLNRAYVRQGLRVMERRARPGLAALADVAGLKRKPDVYALGFVLGPRINAAGRIGHASEALDMLTAPDMATAQRLAARLEKMNKARQELEQRLLEEATGEALKLGAGEGERRPLVVAGKDWHPGVLGLIASRLKEKFSAPVIALGIDAARGAASGSARSVSGVDIGRAVARAVAEGVLEKGGGHAMAAGMSLDAARVDELRAFMEEAMRAELAGLPDAPRLAIDGALAAGGATADLVELLERAGPFGAGNPSPVFAFPAHRVSWASVVGGAHVKCTLKAGDGSTIRAIAFRALDTELGEALLNEHIRPMHIAGRLAIDDWQGRHAAQVLITDAAKMA